MPLNEFLKEGARIVRRTLSSVREAKAALQKGPVSLGIVMFFLLTGNKGWGGSLLVKNNGSRVTPFRKRTGSEES